MKKGIAPLLFGIVVVALVTVAVTVYAGTLTGRWKEYRGLPEARAAVKALPMEIGHWMADEERDLGDLAVTMLKIQDSYVFRTYKNAFTQEVVYVTLMVGPTGRIVTHTPDICFGGRDYEKKSDRSRVPVRTQLLSGEEIEDTFWQTDFIGRSMDVNNRISFYYATSTGGAWNAIVNPRWDLRSYRFVYKLQVEAYSGVEGENDTLRKFLEDCLPTIHEHLRPC